MRAGADTGRVDDLDLGTIDLATLAWLAGSAANEVLLERLRAAGHPSVRISHGYVMQRLVGDTPTVSELAGVLGVTQQAVSKYVSELEQLGYVERRPDPADERIRRVALTARGARLIADARRLRTRLERRLADVVGQGRLDDARAVLIELVDAVGATDSITRRQARPPGTDAPRGSARPASAQRRSARGGAT